VLRASWNQDTLALNHPKDYCESRINRADMIFRVEIMRPILFSVTRTAGGRSETKFRTSPGTARFQAIR